MIIRDSTGRSVQAPYQIQFDRAQVDLAVLPSGLYTIQLLNGSRVQWISVLRY